MTLVQLSVMEGWINRVPDGQEPVVELNLEPNQEVVALDLWERPWDGERKTRDFRYRATIRTRL